MMGRLPPGNLQQQYVVLVVTRATTFGFYVALDLTSPQSTIVTVSLVFPDELPTASMALTTFILFSSATFPKTTCLQSSQAVGAVVKKNCDPLVLGPELAMLKRPASVCAMNLPTRRPDSNTSTHHSSSNLPP